MVKVTITLKDGTVKTYKSEYRCDFMRIRHLPVSVKDELKLHGINIHTPVHEALGATLEHEPLDGRTKEAKKLLYYTVRYLY